MGQCSSTDLAEEPIVIKEINEELEEYKGELSPKNKISEIDLSHNKLKVFPEPLPNLKVAHFEFNNIGTLTKQMIDTLMTYKNLETLILSGNELEKIPQELVNMHSLEKLIIGMNKLTEGDFMFNNLRILDLSQNKFSSLPENLPKSLRILDISYNFIGNLKIKHRGLEELRINLCDLVTIDEETELEHLKLFEASENKIEELPNLSKMMPELGDLNIAQNFLKNLPKLPHSLTKLNAKKNELTEIVLDEDSLITDLNVSFNKLQEINSLPKNIVTLNVSNNEITNIKEMSLPLVDDINFNNNKLPEFPKLDAPKLSIIKLDNNKITKIPEELPPAIKGISFGHNQIEELPYPLFLNKSLKVINVCANKITKMPASFSNSILKSINCSNNEISFASVPSIPEKMEKLYMAYCGVDELPDFTSATLLQTLDISGNHIKSIPQLPSCVLLHAGRNEITEFPRLPDNIEKFDLSFNQISSIKSMALPNLNYADLSYNKLTELPETWQSPNLTTIKLTSNYELKEFSMNGLKFPINHMEIAGTRIIIPDKADIHEIFTHNRLQTPELNPKVVDPLGPISYAETIGLRPSMEDSIIARKIPSGITILGVLDGHHGPKTAASVSRQIIKTFKLRKAEFSEEYLLESTKAINRVIEQHPFGDGTTLAISIIKDDQLIVEHAGDARLLIVKDDGTVKFATLDHKASKRSEFERIHNCGGKVFDGRVQCVIGVSRSIGDFCIPGISSTPDIRTIELEADDKWVIIGCDGVFDVLSNEKIGMISKNALNAEQLAYDIRNIAFSLGSKDNISVVTAELRSLSEAEVLPSSIY